jgi:hypothetical protein
MEKWNAFLRLKILGRSRRLHGPEPFQPTASPAGCDAPPWWTRGVEAGASSISFAVSVFTRILLLSDDDNSFRLGERALTGMAHPDLVIELMVSPEDSAE